MDQPAECKLNSVLLSCDQSVKLVAAAFSLKARSQDNQTRPENWRYVRSMRSWYWRRSFQQWGKCDTRMRQKIEKAPNHVAISSMRRFGFFDGDVNTGRLSNSN